MNILLFTGVFIMSIIAFIGGLLGGLLGAAALGKRFGIDGTLAMGIFLFCLGAILAVIGYFI